MIAEGRLTDVPGVGDAIADIVTKLHQTGSHPSLEKLRKEVPAGVLEILTVPGLRPDKVLRLYKDLGIASLAELEAAAKEDHIKKAKGLGATLQTKILQNLAIGPPPCSNMPTICFQNKPKSRPDRAMHKQLNKAMAVRRVAVQSVSTSTSFPVTRLMACARVVICDSDWCDRAANVHEVCFSMASRRCEVVSREPSRTPSFSRLKRH